MQYYTRDIESSIERFKNFPIIAILGPRQSGKTTLAKHVYRKQAYVNLNDSDLQKLAQTDPKGFIKKFANDNGIIIDEFQNAPKLLSVIKQIVIEHNKPEYFILTGSQNFLMNMAISIFLLTPPQPLADQVGFLTLFPFSLNELEKNNLIAKNPETEIFTGGYPRLYVRDFKPEDIYPAYLSTYIDQEVHRIDIENKSAFQKFLKLCAARIGQLINFSDLAMQCSITVKTAQQWVSALEESYVIFLFKPHPTNFKKRIIKTPKIYFYDTGLACSLLEITSARSLALHPMYGNLFENFIIADLFKQYVNQVIPAPLYFWRTSNGELEIDCLIDKAAKLIPIEIKSGETFDGHFFDGLLRWDKLAESAPSNNYLIYGGTNAFSGEFGHLIPWNKAGNLITSINKQSNDS